MNEIPFTATIKATIPRRTPCMMREGSPIAATSPSQVAAELREYAESAQECFIVLTLNTKNRIIGKHIVSLGLLDQCLVHPREVYRRAIIDNAAAVIVAHNHPSGETNPSAEDIRLTRQLMEAGKTLGIKILDHVIIGINDMDNRLAFTSLREMGSLDFTA